MKTAADSSRRTSAFLPGDLVWLSMKNLTLPTELSRKLAPKFVGPCEVLEQVGAVSYKINLPDGLRKIHPVFHVSLLKKFIGPAPLARAPVFTDDQQ